MKPALDLIHLLGELIPVVWGGLVLLITAYLTHLAYQHTTVEKGPPGWYIAWLMTASVLLILAMAMAGAETAKEIVIDNGQLLPLLIFAGLTPWLGYKGWSKLVENKYGADAAQRRDAPQPPPEDYG